MHVETYHPEVTNWMSLRVNLPRMPRAGIRKRRAAQKALNDDEEDEEEDEEEEEIVPRSGVRARKAAQMALNDDEDDEEEEETNNDEQNSGEVDEMAVDEDAAASNSNDTRAKKMPRRRPTTRLSSKENSQGNTSTQDYRAANESLRQQVSGLVRALSNAVAEEIHGFPFSVEAVRNSLMHFSGGDGQLVEQILDRVVAELSPRPQPQQGVLPYAPILAQHTGPVSSVPLATTYRTRTIDSSPLSDLPSDFDD